MLRGGSWYGGWVLARAASLPDGNPGYRYDYLGFRVVGAVPFS